MDKKHKKTITIILYAMSKTSKNSQIKQITSLDEKHQEMLDKFKSNLIEHIPKLKLDIILIKEQIVPPVKLVNSHWEY